MTPSLKQSVGADQHLDRALGAACEHWFARRRLVPPGEDVDPDADLVQRVKQVCMQLPGEDFRWRHDRHLRPGFDRDQCREQRDHGFAAANVAHDQPHHPLAAPHVRAHGVDGLLLAVGEGEGQGGAHLCAQAAVTAECGATAAAPAFAHDHQRELLGQ